MPKAEKKYISFVIANQWYLMPLEATLSFFHFERILPLPVASPLILGLAYQNGQLITVLSGEKLLSVKEKNPAELYLIFKRADELFALSVVEGGQVIGSSQVFQDKQAKVFKNYIKYKQEKFYILEPEKIFEQLGL